VIGAVLAGGAGRRMAARGRPAAEAAGAADDAMGGPGAWPSKAAARLAGLPLVAYPLRVLTEVCTRVAIVCKRDTALPETPGVERWDEPDEPRHPLTGLVHALDRAGEPVLLCAADMPFVTAGACRALLAASPLAGAGGATAPPARRHRDRDGPLAVVATTEDRELEPLLGVYLPRALPALASAPADAPLRRSVAALEPVRVPIPRRLLRSVNTPAELATAEDELAGPVR
jgi:molybdopterin-guanine dinucleotide biosynthesis protein A